MRLVHDGPDRSFPFDFAQLTEAERQFVLDGGGSPTATPRVVVWYRKQAQKSLCSGRQRQIGFDHQRDVDFAVRLAHMLRTGLTDESRVAKPFAMGG